MHFLGYGRLISQKSPFLFLRLKWLGYCYMAVFHFLFTLNAACVCILDLGIIHPQQALKARSRRLGEYRNAERWQAFAAVGSWGIDNYIIVSHSVPTWTCLNVISNCRFSLFPTSETLFNLCSDHESGTWLRVCSVGNSYSGIAGLDLAIVVCDTYW